jgi:hypothetical protein
MGKANSATTGDGLNTFDEMFAELDQWLTEALSDALDRGPATLDTSGTKGASGKRNSDVCFFRGTRWPLPAA